MLESLLGECLVAQLLRCSGDGVSTELVVDYAGWAWRELAMGKDRSANTMPFSSEFYTTLEIED